MLFRSFRDFMVRVVGQILGIPLSSQCRIVPGLYVGAEPKYFGRHSLRTMGVREVVCLIDGPECKSQTGKNGVTHLPLPEFVGITTEVLMKYASIVKDFRSKGYGIFIHCREGVGRAPMVAAALLMLEGATLEDASQLVQSGRRVANLNEAQITSLELFSKRLSED